MFPLLVTLFSSLFSLPLSQSDISLSLTDTPSSSSFPHKYPIPNCSSYSIFLIPPMASLSFFLFTLLLISSNTIATQEMEQQELLGLFEVMGSLLNDHDWPKAHPFPCSDTPWPGVKCEIGPSPPFFHVTKIHIGPDILDPPCKISANLSDSLLKLPYLKSLSIFNCFTSSSVALFPALFDSLLYLEHLSLQSNPSLSGEIPSSLGNAASLRVLSLSQNSLNGVIPLSIGGLVRLEQLDLSYNKLSGEVPQSIGGLKSLSILDLSWNALEGELTSSLGQLQLLQKIDLSSNQLRGKIPLNLGTLKSLEKLKSISLSECRIEGSIPMSLSSLKTLTALSLSHNNLSGGIPKELGKLPNLDLLNLSHNQLSGEVYFTNGFVRKLGKRLDLRGNYGVCWNNNMSVDSDDETPYCLNSNGGTKNESEEDYKKIQPAWNQWEDDNSSTTTRSNHPSWDKNLLLSFCAFVVEVVLCSCLLL
ncbi:hypothetical protein IC582_029197 [Cucumis melo]